MNPIKDLNEAAVKPLQYKGHRDQRWGHISYAQHGDDFMLVNIFDMLGINLPTYLDIGAHHPTDISNTKLLYDRGSRGVNVEANPNLVEAFRKERPGDVTINVGVGVIRGEATFYMYSDTSGRNTFSAREVKDLENIMTVKKSVLLPIKTLNEIVDETWGGNWPHLLSIDIEGLDYDVLESASFSGFENKVGPMVICVEVRRHLSYHFIQLLSARGYRCYCRMGENLFFVRAHLLDRLF